MLKNKSIQKTLRNRKQEINMCVNRLVDESHMHVIRSQILTFVAKKKN